MKFLGEHPNIIGLKSAFYVSTETAGNEELYINFVLEYMPEDLSMVFRSYRMSKK
jgi:glycogen synthase kinase 3 beta